MPSSPIAISGKSITHSEIPPLPPLNPKQVDIQQNSRQKIKQKIISHLPRRKETVHTDPTSLFIGNENPNEEIHQINHNNKIHRSKSNHSRNHHHEEIQIDNLVVDSLPINIHNSNIDNISRQTSDQSNNRLSATSSNSNIENNSAINRLIFSREEEKSESKVEHKQKRPLSLTNILSDNRSPVDPNIVNEFIIGTNNGLSSPKDINILPNSPIVQPIETPNIQINPINEFITPNYDSLRIGSNDDDINNYKLSMFYNSKPSYTNELLLSDNSHPVDPSIIDYYLTSTTTNINTPPPLSPPKENKINIPILKNRVIINHDQISDKKQEILPITTNIIINDDNNNTSIQERLKNRLYRLSSNINRSK